MGKIELTQTIAASPRHVFAFFAPRRMPCWYGKEMDSCFELQDDAPDFGVSLKIRISGRIGSRNVSHTAVVTAFEPARLLEWRFQDAYGVRGRERWELESVSGGSPGAEQTLIRFLSEYELPGPLGRLLDMLVTRRAVAWRARQHLRRLATLVEGRAEPARSWGMAR
jgi:hypothetical protein